MKKIIALEFLAFVFLVFPFCGFAYVVGDVNSDNKVNLTEAIYALQLMAGSRAPANSGTPINVPGQFATIQAAIDAAVSGDIISVVAGAYTETLNIKNKALTIQGAGKNSTTITGGAGADTLTIDSAKVVIISGVTIQGGKAGIYAKRETAIEVSEVIVQDTTDRGILIDENSTARLTNVTVQRSGMDGIFAFRNSSITFFGIINSNNNIRDGVIILNSSSAFFSGATVTVDTNGRNGINVGSNAGLLADGSSITIRNGLGNANNMGGGIQVLGSSSIELQNSSSILNENNGVYGIGMSSSSFYLDPTSSLTVRGSIGNGFSLSQASSLHIQGNVTIQNSIEAGLALTHSNVKVDSPGILTVSGTTGKGTGVNLTSTSAVHVNGGLLVNNNKNTIGASGLGAGAGISINTGSQVHLDPKSPKTALVQNNDKGINAWEGSGVSGAGSIAITGNTIVDLDIAAASRGNLPAGSYGTAWSCGSPTTATIIFCH
jgi:hypothetical protein